MRKLLILTILLLPLSAAAQESATLAEYLRVGLEHNYDIRIVRNNERITRNNATRGNAGYLPSAELSAGFTGMAGNDGGHSENANAGVDVGWTLFDGFSVQTNYLRLKELQQMGELETRAVTEEFIALFTSEYYNYIYQHLRLQNLQHAVELSRERYEIVAVSEQAGRMSGYDVQQARVDLNADSSRLVKQYEVLHSSGMRLSELLAGDNATTPLQPSDKQIVYDAALSRDELQAKTIESNTALLLAQKDGDIGRLDLKVLQGRNFPNVRLGAGYGYAGTPGRPYTLGVNYGATLGFTLFDGMNRRREQRNARIGIENRELTYDRLKLAVGVELSNTWMAYENNLKLVEMERENLATAQLGYSLAMERYRAGQLSGIELREAQTSLLDAGERLAQVRYDVKLCEIQLLRMAGMVGKYLE